MVCLFSRLLDLHRVDNLDLGPGGLLSMGLTSLDMRTQVFGILLSDTAMGPGLYDRSLCS